MRRTLALALAASLALAPAAVHAQDAAPAAPVAPQAAPAVPDTVPEAAEAAAAGWPVDRHLMALGAGAIVGIVAFNVLTGPLGTVPLAGGALAAVPYDVALGSRILATLSAGAGALGATYAYDQWTGHETDYRYWLTLGAGALAGVAAGNLMTAGTLGALPYYAGAGAASAGGAVASSATQAFSRIAVITTGVMGAWAADWLYGTE
ncbi:hypothetical protein [Azospirillum halopraeferens]|uniref:hypothetical protein n=1 Tax=Azospirillum halopraeferens TaxID=34010 RepID=UPI0003F633D6|nr:hypothetical protein [Azospirillum halopraeferens]